MDIAHRKNLIYRLVAGLLVFFSGAMAGFSIYSIMTGESKSKVLPYIACGVVLLFVLFEAVLLWKGGKKDLALNKISFNENRTINTVPLIAVFVGTAFGLGLLILCLVLYFTREGEPYRTSSLVILSIVTYLLANCLVYFLDLIVFKKREVDLQKMIR